ncbi:DUF835 domain-containing protein [Thermococcus stetteri]|uniref:DUF835 domain-containing protein n=1 Tax=Thermococcus stetteri TaxID=49900 RepID=UPI001AE87AEF|nr:DUF835 domain-containing protein [Thermococcus stetteri]MBP1911208.1 hypothetical protein [Thermococcus stetteri]
MLLLGAIISIYQAWYYYKRVPEPWKSLAKRALVSLLFFGLGSVGVVIDSLTPRPLWFLIVIFYTISYAAILSTIFLSLRAVATVGKPEELTETSSAPEISSEVEGERGNLPLTGGYALRNEPPHTLFRILKRTSNGLIVVSRKSREEWSEKLKIEPDEFIWLSRADIKGAVDPSKLHVIQGKILQFIESRGPVVVYFDGLEYLTLYNDFSSVAKFLFAVKDMIMIKNSLMLIHLPRGIFDTKQEVILLREFEEITEKELIRRLRQSLPLEEADELALFGVLPPTTTKKQESGDAGGKSPKGGGRASKKEAQETRPLRREEKTEEKG